MEKKSKNRANQLAKEYMVTALMQLLKEKPLSSISVSELTRRAGVSRMTYYRNYSRKEDIFVSYLGDIIADYNEDFRDLPQKGMYYDYKNLLHCFCYFKAHKDFISSVFQCGMGHVLLQGLSEYILKTWHHRKEDKEEYYTLQAFAGSLYHVYISWLINEVDQTPEEMATILNRIYRRGKLNPVN